MSGPLSPRPFRSALKHSSTPTSPTTSPPPLPPASLPLLSPPPHDNHHSGTHTPASGSNGPGYTTKVSFDTFATTTDAMFSFTLQVKSDDYQKTRNTRVYLCGASGDESGQQALEWTLDSLVEDGDEIVAVRGFELADLHRDMHDQIRDEARDLMKFIVDRNSEYEGRDLSIIVEFVAGKVTDTIDRMIALYRPDSVVVGTRGERNLMQTWGAALRAPGVGSVSKYCVHRSPVPVIVVRPERKVRKSVEKRRANPKRRAQFEELTKTKSFSGVGA